MTTPSGTTTTEAGGSASLAVRLATEPTADVTVSVASLVPTEGTVSVGTLTFTRSNWMTAQTVTVTGVADSTVDGNRSYDVRLLTSSADGNYHNLALAPTTFTNTDVDVAQFVLSMADATTTEAGGAAVLSVQLASRPSAAVTLTLRTSDATEGAPETATLTFTAANWNVAQTVRVVGVNDALDDGNIGYTIDGTAASLDANYNGRTIAPIALTNTDDDTAGVRVSTWTFLSELGGTTTLSVELTSEPMSDVRIALASSDPSAATLSPTELVYTPANWNIAQTVTATGVRDDIVAGNRSVSVSFAVISTDTCYGGMAVAPVALTVTDTNVNDVRVTTPGGTRTSEAGGTAALSLTLGARPSADVVVTVTVVDPFEATVSSSTLTFTSADWETAQTVTVTGRDDHIVDSDTSYQVRFQLASADPAFASVPASTLTLVNADDDTANLIVVDTTADADDTTAATFAELLRNRGTDGSISLREALRIANATANGTSPDEIRFALPGAGDHTIRLRTALPDITDAIVIDGRTDPAYTAGHPVVVLTAASGSTAVDGLRLVDGSTSTVDGVGSDGSTIAGLVIVGFSGDGLRIESDGNTIVSNHLGVDTTGTVALGNGMHGLVIARPLGLPGPAHLGASGNTVTDNVIGGNVDGGVILSGVGTDGNTLRANFIGTDRSGTVNLGNRNAGVALQQGASENTVGGTADGAGNLIANNVGHGVHLYENPSPTGNAVLRNTFWGAGQQPIGLSGTVNSAPTVLGNDTDDLDGGANAQQNYPVLSNARPGTLPNTAIVDGVLDTRPGTYRIDYYRVMPSPPLANGGNAMWIGSQTVTTDSDGDASWSGTVVSGLQYRDRISATATRIDTSGLVDVPRNTSEFARNVLVNATPVQNRVSNDFYARENGVAIRSGSGMTGASGPTAVDEAPSGLRWSFNPDDAADNALFTIDPITGELAFIAAPDFENSRSNSGDTGRGANAYRIAVRVTDENGSWRNRTYWVNVGDVNEAPLASAPAAVTAAEDTRYTFSASNGNALSVTDPDRATASINVSLAVDRGQITLASTDGLSFTDGAGGSAQSLTFSGSSDDIARALASVVYQPVTDYNGPVTLTLSARDGSDGALTTTASVAITVQAVNDAPVLTTVATSSDRVQAGATLEIDTPRLSAADVDDATDAIVYTVTRTQGAGTLTRNGESLGTGARFTQADIDAGRIAFEAATQSGLATVELSVSDAAGARAAGAPVTMRFIVDSAAAASSDVTASTSGGPAGRIAAAGAQNAAGALAGDASSGGGDAAGAKVAASAAAANATAIASSGARSASGSTGATAASGSGGIAPAAASAAIATAASNAADAGGGVLLAVLRDSASAGGWVPAGGAGFLGYGGPSQEPRRGSDTAGNLDAGRRFGTLAALQTPAAAVQQAWSPVAALREAVYQQELAQVRNDTTGRFEVRDLIATSSVALTTSLSIGYVVWLLRGGVLLTSLLASMPAWRSIDPLPVLARVAARGKDDEGEDDSLRGLLERAAQNQADAAEAAARPVAPVGLAAADPIAAGGVA